MEDHKKTPSRPALTQVQHQQLLSLKARFRDYIKAHGRFDFSRVWPDKRELKESLGQLVEIKTILDDFRPLDALQSEKVRQAFDITYTYESNRIEGNSLTLSETSLVIQDGLTVAGKPLKDHLEAVNHQQAITFIRTLVETGGALTADTLLRLHALVLDKIDTENAGHYRKEDVVISGSRHTPPPAVQVEALMEEFFADYDLWQESMHPVELAAHAHARLVEIHPFIDGNGRTARLVMNLVLLAHGYPMAVISSEPEGRAQYYDALERHHTLKDDEVFVQLVAGAVKKQLFAYLRIVGDDMTEKSNGRGYLFFKAIEPFV